MTTVSTNARQAVHEGVALPRSRPGFHPSLTAGERRLLLATADLVLINSVLLACVLIWHNDHTAAGLVALQPKWFVTISLLWLACGASCDVYNLARSARRAESVAIVAATALIAATVYVFIPWLTPALVKRSYAFALIAGSVIAVAGWRALYVLVLARPAFSTRLLILGTGQIARSLERDLGGASPATDGNPFAGSGYVVVGLVSEHPVDVAPLGPAPAPVVGDVSRLVSLARHYHADAIVVALDPGKPANSYTNQILLDCYELGFRVQSWSDVYEWATSRVPISYGGLHIQQLLGAIDRGSYRLYMGVKILSDRVFALLGLPLLALIAGPLAVGNALTSPGPLFHRQERIGKGGRPFVVLKFRSMIPDAESRTGPMWSPVDDPRVTPIGRWLRRTHLDELPHIINVLRGEMSLVGPRPERPRLTGELAGQLAFYRARHALRPGITGWAQVHQGYGNSVDDSRIKLEYDLYYVKHAGFRLDLHIALRTAAVMIGLKGH